ISVVVAIVSSVPLDGGVVPHDSPDPGTAADTMFARSTGANTSPRDDNKDHRHLRRICGLTHLQRQPAPRSASAKPPSPCPASALPAPPTPTPPAAKNIATPPRSPDTHATPAPPSKSVARSPPA